MNRFDRGEGEIMRIREGLNNIVKAYGNKMVYSDTFKYGLGNLLTTEVTFTKTGTLAGISLPFVSYYLCSPFSFPLNVIDTFAMSPLLAMVSPFTGVIGWGTGGSLDDLIKKYSKPKNK